MKRRLLTLLLGLVLTERIAFAVWDTDPRGQSRDYAPELHARTHRKGANDYLPIFLSDSEEPGPPGAVGDVIVAAVAGGRTLWQTLATGAAGTVFIGGSTFSANLLLSGYERVGSATAPTNVTPGDLTVVRLSVGDVAITANVEAQVNGDALVTGYMRLGSATNPTNVTAGDLTVTRLIVGDAALGAGVEAQVTGDAAVSGWTRIGSTAAPTNTTAGDLTAARLLAGDATLASGVVAAFAGNQTVTGWVNVGSATAPANTTAGDLTALRGHFGTDTSFTSGAELEVTGDAVVSSSLKVGGNLGFYGTAPIAQQTSGANLTNNVTAGGVNDTIANFTDLVTFTNSAATIRNNEYQLARKVKQINDALRAYGILT